MPVYEYKCNCGKEFEKIVNMFEKVKCPNCGEPLKQLISKSTFILKGKGWASTGYSKGGD